MSRRIPIIDLFAGPGGLGEGFSAFATTRGVHPFKIALSVEKDPIAHKTLTLRSFFRQFPHGDAPDAYYRRLRLELTTCELFDRFPKQSEAARNETWRATLGDDSEAPASELRHRVRNALKGEEQWVLIGGPPCQAYSLAGRSRNKGIANYTLADDPKAKLYVEYLQLIADFWPAIFVMENVKGLLSAKIGGESVFQQIVTDLSDPAAALNREGRGRVRDRRRTYRLRALTNEGLFTSPSDFLVRCEQHGIPQARHRVIIVGIRDDVDADRMSTLVKAVAPSVDEMLSDLPPVRSGVSREPDSTPLWTAAVKGALAHDMPADVARLVREVTRDQSSRSSFDRGHEFVSGSPCIQFERTWFVDSRLKGFCNHAARSHIAADLHRYLFAACFAQLRGHSPELSEFPASLRPKHRNVGMALTGSHFADRFRVQLKSRYATTITSHISKDGHYYIHPAAAQCRSLTVREAARLQTFPDNYFFEGPRTAQYIQVGNAVPPLLARQIASLVNEIF